MKDLAIIILNYNSYSDVTRQIIEFSNDAKIKDGLIILDNNSDDGNALSEFCDEKDVFFHQMGSNLGYAHANNWGLKKAISLGKTTFLLLNPDIHIKTKDIDDLYKTLEDNPDLGVVGPRLLYAEEPSKIFSDGGLLFPKKGFEGNHVHFNKNIDEVKIEGLNYNIDYVNGSSMMFKKEVLDELGFMIEELFMYYEESEWCYRIKNKSKWKIAIDTDVVAYQSDSSRGKVYEYYMTRNRIWLTKKYSGNLFFVLRERMIFARKKLFSSKGKFKDNLSFSRNVVKGIFDGLTNKLTKL
ncbi:glycosyltransferase [Chryseobacterium sp. 3008163]|uniref:glycosyltransferase n=1 Tax=Chryseobacterium sp. 3008163 TaxID=2478663 RepID=UPI000F0CAC0A|nr:glycosyltransferase family 2 protein [Chryseobacterium sp. 3008163]AYN01199.1 glycosyltransferase family 2 protein [Chryseobacterium sp. 3008163]